MDRDALDPNVIEPGTPRLENVVLVVIGAVSALGVVYHLVTLFG